MAGRSASRRAAAFTILEILIVVVIIGALAALVIPQVDRGRENAEQVTADASLAAVEEAFAGGLAGPGYLADMKFVPGFRAVNVRMHDLLSPSSWPSAAVYDPVSARGWRGPYLRNAGAVQNTESTRRGLFPAAADVRFAGDVSFQARGFFDSGGVSAYGSTGDLAVADAWGNPVVLQVPPVAAFSNSSADEKRFRYARIVSAGPDGILSTPLTDPLLGRLGGKLADGTTAARGDDLVRFLNRPDVYEAEEP